jgi:hypothetical protein
LTRQLKKFRKAVKKEGAKRHGKDAKGGKTDKTKQKRFTAKKRSRERLLLKQADIVAQKLGFRHGDFKAQMRDELTALALEARARSPKQGGKSSTQKVSSSERLKAFAALPLATKLQRILEFSSLPGISRHHWGTDIDINSVDHHQWDPAEGTDGNEETGAFAELGEFMASEGAELGLEQVYTPGRDGGYKNEAWHLTDSPISKEMLRIYIDVVDIEQDVIIPASKAIMSMLRSTEIKRFAYSEGALAEGMRSIKIMSYMTEVNPNVKPEGE